LEQLQRAKENLSKALHTKTKAQSPKSQSNSSKSSASEEDGDDSDPDFPVSRKQDTSTPFMRRQLEIWTLDEQMDTLWR
jgi:hypothetical protein